MVSRRAFCGAALAALASPLAGQDAPVVIVDINRIYRESLLGQRFEAEMQRLELELATENQAIVEALRAEELELTEQRPSMEPEAFRMAAAEFNQRVETIRAEQDAKEVALRELRAQSEERFVGLVRPFLRQIMAQRQATVAVEPRDVFDFAAAADVTDDVIARLDAAYAETGEAE